MGLGVQAKQDEFKLNDLLKVICFRSKLVITDLTFISDI